MNNIVASETTLKREAYAIAKQAFDLIQSKAIAFVKELLSDDLAPNGRLRRFTSARQKQSTETPFADLAGLTSLTPDTLNNNVALSNTPSVAPISATAAFVAPSLSRSLSNKFTVAQSPTFVNRDVAKAILTHRDVALRDANDMAANNFIGPQTPAVATQIRALNSWKSVRKARFNFNDWSS